MGIIITYYVVEDDLIEKGKDLTFDIIEYINDELLQHHEYENREFWRCGIEFGTGVKAWNPTIELIKYLDCSSENIIKKILNTKKFGGIDGPPYFIKSDDVKKVWNELKKISVDKIEKSVANDKITKLIKASNGYRMEAIEYKPLIVLEFLEIFKAFYQAQSRANGIVIHQS